MSLRFLASLAAALVLGVVIPAGLIWIAGSPAHLKSFAVMLSAVPGVDMLGVWTSFAVCFFGVWVAISASRRGPRSDKRHPSSGNTIWDLRRLRRRHLRRDWTA
jgi:hypothetical protein